MHGLPVATDRLDFAMSQSFPPDTDPAYILQQIGKTLEMHGLHLVRLFARDHEGGPTYADYKLPAKTEPTPDNPMYWVCTECGGEHDTSLVDCPAP